MKERARWHTDLALEVGEPQKDSAESIEFILESTEVQGSGGRKMVR